MFEVLGAEKSIDKCVDRAAPRELHGRSGVKQIAMIACPFLLGVALALPHVGCLYWCCCSSRVRPRATASTAYDVGDASARFGPGMARRRAEPLGHLLADRLPQEEFDRFR